jgi:hypothetical protein
VHRTCEQRIDDLKVILAKVAEVGCGLECGLLLVLPASAAEARATRSKSLLLLQRSLMQSTRRITFYGMLTMKQGKHRMCSAV